MLDIYRKTEKKKGFKEEKLKSLFCDVVKCPNDDQLKGKRSNQTGVQ